MGGKSGIQALTEPQRDREAWMEAGKQSSIERAAESNMDVDPLTQEQPPRHGCGQAGRWEPGRSQVGPAAVQSWWDPAPRHLICSVPGAGHPP